jgi:protein required for attachment to host cells
MEIVMQTQWVVVADSSRARFFEAQGNLESLVELEDLLSPAGRMDETELRHDAKGRFYGKGEREQAHTAEPAVSAKTYAAQQFSKAVMQRLEQACEKKRYDRLILVAPPHFLGQLHKQLSQRVMQRITQELPLDISGLSATQIGEHLRRHRR